jgi:hypothetical protein
MKHRPLAVAALVLLVPLSTVAAHDLYLKLNSYLLPAGATRVRVPVLNGTFTKSQAAVTTDRVTGLALASAAGTQTLAADAWEARGDSAFVTLALGAPGTYTVGAATRPRTLTLKAAEFATYLREEGLGWVNDERRRAGEAERPARERYSKHVKAVFQKGVPRTAGFDAVLGHAAELVPLTNPYTLSVGDTLVLRALVDGRPSPGEVAIAGGVLPTGRAIAGRRLRADDAGLVRVPLVAPGRWYVKFINMRRLTGDAAADYESKWATLTFGVRD